MMSLSEISKVTGLPNIGSSSTVVSGPIHPSYSKKRAKAGRGFRSPAPRENAGRAA